MTKKIIKVGITGATGNLGRRFIQLLLQRQTADQDYEIRCLVRNPDSMAQDLREKVDVIRGGLNDLAALTEFVKDLDICINFASLVGYGTVQQYHLNNVVGTDNLCCALRDTNPACRLIQCSSIAVLRRNQTLTWLNTDYANSKYQADMRVEHHRQTANLNATFVYPGLIYGPEERNLLPTLKRYLNKGLMFYIRGGEKCSPLIYIDDLCSLFFYAMDHDLPSGKKLIGVGPQEIGIHQFIAQVARELGEKEPRLKLPKYLLVPFAIVLEQCYKWLKIAKFPVISRRSIDFLSINLSPELVRECNQNHWQATTPIQSGLEKALVWSRAENLI